MSFNAGTVLLIVAIAFLAATAWDWRRTGGGLTPKRRAWLLIAAVFLAVTLYNRLGGG